MIIKYGENSIKNEAPAIYSEMAEIDTGDVDYKRQLKVSAIHKIFQEVATEHTKLLKCAMSDLAEKNLTWVISKMYTNIIRRPNMFERVLVKTWATKPVGKIVERDFTMEDMYGNIIVRATSKWCIIDMNTRKPVEISSFPHKEPTSYYNVRAMEAVFPDYYGEDLKEHKYLEFERVVRLSDLDLNNHMNNTIYIDLIFDILTREEYDKNTFEGLYIKYKKEARFGDKIVIRKYTVKDLICIKGFVDDREIFEAVVDILTDEEKKTKLGIKS